MKEKAWKHGLMIMAAATLSGCATKSDQPFKQSAFDKGAVVLTCDSIGCAGSWGSSAARMRSQYDSRQWDELARSVVATNFPYDLAYYYLGRAAEGKGHYGAAANYYRAAQIGRKCASFINVCSGLDVPSLAADRLKLVSNGSPATAGMGMADAQARLKGLGWYSGALDGLYGPRTAKALKDYQRSVGLPQSGIVDSATANALADVTPSTSIGATTRPVDRKPTPVAAQAKSSETGSRQVKPAETASTQAKSAEAPSTQAAAGVNSEGSVGQATVLLSKAELLDNPDPFASVITIISSGSRVNLIERSGDWALVEYDGKKGYVYADQLR